MPDISALKKEYCSDNRLTAAQKSFCEGYVDQCAQQILPTDPNKSTFEIKTESGVTEGNKDFRGCVGFAAFAAAAHGKPLGFTGAAAVSEPAKPAQGTSENAQTPVAVSPAAEPKVVYGCKLKPEMSTGRFQDRRPIWARPDPMEKWSEVIMFMEDDKYFTDKAKSEVAKDKIGANYCGTGRGLKYLEHYATNVVTTERKKYCEDNVFSDNQWLFFVPYMRLTCRLYLDLCR